MERMNGQRGVCLFRQAQRHHGNEEKGFNRQVFAIIGNSPKNLRPQGKWNQHLYTHMLITRDIRTSQSFLGWQYHRLDVARRLALGTAAWKSISFSKLKKGKIIFNHSSNQAHSQGSKQQRLKHRLKKTFQERTDILGQDLSGSFMLKIRTTEAKSSRQLPAVAVSPRVEAGSAQQSEKPKHIPNPSKSPPGHIQNLLAETQGKANGP